MRASDRNLDTGPVVLHYVEDALPVQAGYTIRTHNLAMAQRSLGVSASVCLAPGRYTEDREGLYGSAPRYSFDDIPYMWFHPGLSPDTMPYRMVKRLSEVPVMGFGRLRRRLDVRALGEWIGAEAGIPDIIHAHSPSRAGREGLRMSRYFKCAFVYEVRGFWELSQAAAGGKDVSASRAAAGDAAVAGSADRVVAICRGIADQLVKGGVRKDRITIVPNAVDCGRFRPIDRDADLAASLKLEDSLVFGYATNIRRLEGIQTIIEAWPRIRERIPNAAFLLLGEGDYLGELKALARDYGVEGSWKFIGRVPHTEIRSYYSLFDVCVVPRIPEPVCQMVTPLKPLESMAMRIPLVMSDVSALREMVEEGETALLFNSGNPESLAAACVRIGTDSALRRTLSDKAYEWVTRNRNWSDAGRVMRGLYEDILAERT